jgi:hypothetical protein
MNATMVLRLCGQASIRPSGVVDQACVRMSAPISPPPARKSVLVVGLGLPCKRVLRWRGCLGLAPLLLVPHPQARREDIADSRKLAKETLATSSHVSWRSVNSMVPRKQRAEPAPVPLP